MSESKHEPDAVARPFFVRCREIGAMVALLAVQACAPGADAPPGPALSPFSTDTDLTARVLDNDAGCTVDAACTLRLEFADTTLTATYGWGERPAPPCAVPGEVSDAAFGTLAGEVVLVRVGDCGPDGPYVQALARETR